MDRRLHGLAIYCLSRKVSTPLSALPKTNSFKSRGLASIRSRKKQVFAVPAPRKSQFPNPNRPSPSVAINHFFATRGTTRAQIAQFSFESIARKCSISLL